MVGLEQAQKIGFGTGKGNLTWTRRKKKMLDNTFGKREEEENIFKAKKPVFERQYKSRPKMSEGIWLEIVRSWDSLKVRLVRKYNRK